MCNEVVIVVVYMKRQTQQTRTMVGRRSGGNTMCGSGSIAIPCAEVVKSDGGTTMCRDGKERQRIQTRMKTRRRTKEGSNKNTEMPQTLP